MQCQASWETGAYLSCGELWFCLSYDKQAGVRSKDYTHCAFSLRAADFGNMVSRSTQAGMIYWKEDRSEGGAFYFRDPDNHQLALHVGSLASRREACRAKPYSQMVFYPDAANNSGVASIRP